jgi:periplasmic mercuric ion binding protein
MKTKQIISSIVLSVLIGFTANNATAQKNMNVCQIKAKVDCNGCKTKIEENIAFEKGVKDVNANVETKIVVIKYQKNKNTAENFVKVIQGLGYGGEVISDAAYTKSCCDSKDKDATSCDGKHKDGKSCDGKHKDGKSCDENHKDGKCCGDKKTTECTGDHKKTDCKSKEETDKKKCGTHID